MEHVTRPQEENEYYFEEGCYILEMSQADVDPEVSIARARVEPGRTTRFHRLKDTFERYIMLSGTGRVEVGDHDPVEVCPGDVVRIPPMIDQRITNIGQEDLVFLAICNPHFLKSIYIDSEDLRQS
ncbi:MAG: cupin domain-containing protein [Planctomycetes bacterium]|nr:cupin domain-containing protein [Planctomycetota bacterium]MCH9724798.1 cupin domain-containing protein [Planctomycetota bacterium]MCH9778738.1 cupin domain-containing protein [Planctomycetota bacterium]MCH9790946.1 cupin domain-containing protein [Planctomycetota bacterium]